MKKMSLLLNQKKMTTSLFNRSETMKRLWRYDKLLIQAGLPPKTKLRNSRQLKIRFYE